MVDVDNLTENVAINVSWFRESKDLSMRELARKAGVTNAHISRIEAGLVKNLYVPQLALIANALEVTIDELVGDPVGEKMQVKIGRRRKPAAV